MNLGFVGTGEITAAMVTGLCSGSTRDVSIRLSPRNHAIATRLADRFPAVSIASSNQDVLDCSDVIVIAVRLPMASSVLAELRFRPEHGVISVVSGLSRRRLSELIVPAARIVRAVPLPSKREGMDPQGSTRRTASHRISSRGSEPSSRSTTSRSSRRCAPRRQPSPPSAR